MDTVRRAAVLKYAAAAYEMGLERFEGKLLKDENGKWQIGSRSLDGWLQAHEGEEIVAVLASLADNRPVRPRSCRTCGRDYMDVECPHCRASRIRLRGK